MTFTDESGRIEFKAEAGQIFFRLRAPASAENLLDIHLQVDPDLRGGGWAPVPPDMMDNVPEEVLAETQNQKETDDEP